MNVLQLKYYLSEIRKKWKNKEWWEARISEYIIHPVSLIFTPGIYIFLEDWDYLIILDACRYDIFKQEIVNWDIKGKLECKISRGANTGLFIKNNFNEDLLENISSEIVYVTANPWVTKLLKKYNKIKVISVWKWGWNEEIDTVPPEPVYETMLKVVSKYPDKKIICHFLQPHGPCIKLDKQTKKYVKVPSNINTYIECLRTVMPYVKKLCQILPGKVVVTADHGDAFNDKVWMLPIRIWGHHPPLRIKSLIEVPWFIVDNRAKTETMKLKEKAVISSRIEKLKIMRKI